MGPKPIDPKGKQTISRTSRAPPESHQSDDEDHGSSTTPVTNAGSSNPDNTPGTSSSLPSDSSQHSTHPHTTGVTTSQPHTNSSSVHIAELNMIPINIWTDPPLRRASNNWKPWSLQMTLILRIYKAYAYVEGNEIRPDSTEQVSFSNWRTNHFMVCAFILSAIDVNERYDYSQYSKADELWKALMAVYDFTGIMSKMDAMAQLMSMSFMWTTTVTEHYHTIINLANTIFQDGPLSKDDIILHSLLLSLNNETTKGDMKLARKLLDSKPNAGHYDVYHSLCIAESERKFGETKSNQLIALVSNTKSSKKTKIICANCKKRGHEEAFCIMPKGGMEGKTIEEARLAQRNARDETKGKDKDKKTFRFTNGKALFVNDGKVYSVDESGNVFAVTETIKDVVSLVTDSLSTQHR